MTTKRDIRRYLDMKLSTILHLGHTIRFDGSCFNKLWITHTNYVIHREKVVLKIIKLRDQEVFKPRWLVEMVEFAGEDISQGPTPQFYMELTTGMNLIFCDKYRSQIWDNTSQTILFSTHVLIAHDHRKHKYKETFTYVLEVIAPELARIISDYAVDWHCVCERQI